jgi:hypothetical protein
MTNVGGKKKDDNMDCVHLTSKSLSAGNTSEKLMFLQKTHNFLAN